MNTLVGSQIISLWSDAKAHVGNGARRAQFAAMSYYRESKKIARIMEECGTPSDRDSVRIAKATQFVASIACVAFKEPEAAVGLYCLGALVRSYCYQNALNIQRYQQDGVYVAQSAAKDTLQTLRGMPSFLIR